eukprot:3830174-Pleurochrysis_carterae.AAC.1
MEEGQTDGRWRGEERRESKREKGDGLRGERKKKRCMCGAGKLHRHTKKDRSWNNKRESESES